MEREDKIIKITYVDTKTIVIPVEREHCKNEKLLQREIDVFIRDLTSGNYLFLSLNNYFILQPFNNKTIYISTSEIRRIEIMDFSVYAIEEKQKKKKSQENKKSKSKKKSSKEEK